MARHLIDHIHERFDDELQATTALLAFVNNPPLEPCRIWAPVPKVLEKVSCNLKRSDRHFSTLANDSKYEEVLAKWIYKKNLKAGKGTVLDSPANVIASFAICTFDGELVGSEIKKQMSLQDVIPGLALGIRGMREG